MSQFDRADDGQGADDLMQLVIDQIEELLVTVLEVVRERPIVVAAIAAGIVGALVGATLAGSRQSRRPQPPVPDHGDVMDLLAGLLGAIARAQVAALGDRAADSVSEQASKARKASRSGLGLPLKNLAELGNLSDLAGLSMQLLENPLVRSYLRSFLTARLRRGFSR